MDEDRTKEFIRVWDQLAAKTQLIEDDLGDVGVMTTIMPEAHTLSELEELRVTLNDLPMVRITREHQTHGDIQLRDTLGQGGMGVVYLAHQRTLRRDVAVKTLRADRDQELTKREILREAWVTGRLEHPNIVPIHSLGLDATGRPIIVMKRVEGLAWFDAIHDPSKLPELYQGMDPLEAHLRILMQVCNAIHFAHTRGIVHRDIKPDNVMLGEFGEVYVLDWGIAVSTLEEDEGTLPLASKATQPAGTPGYMAPEMVEGAGIGVHSDIYLLGAVLHEIMMGRPRHHAGSVRAAMLSSFVSAPFDYSKTSTVPDELGALANEAMSKEPADRTPSALVFRQKIDVYLQRRESHRMREDGDTRVAAAYAMIEGGVPETDGEMRALRRQVTEALFAYQHALTLWPGNTRAKESMVAFLCEVAAFELERGDLGSTEGICAMLPNLPPELETKLEALREQKRIDEKNVEHAKRIKRESDVNVSSRSRAIAAILVLVIWTISGAVKDSIEQSAQVDVSITWIVAALVTGVVYGFRTSLLNTRVNRDIMSIFLIAVYGMGLMRTLGTLMLEMSVASCLLFERMLAGALIAQLAFSVDRRIFAIVWVMPVAGVLTGMYPEWERYFTNASNLLVFGSFAFIWSLSKRSMGQASSV